MARYFVEVAYLGANYSGFQVQLNANTIQAEIEKAFSILYTEKFKMTGASRTDSGVHAFQNFFHFDSPIIEIQEKHIYNLNAILPDDIVIKNLYKVNNDSHCRFDALSRSYEYVIYNKKDPFLKERAYYFPYNLDIKLLNEAAQLLTKFTDFSSFSKRNTQVNNFNCVVEKSLWEIKQNKIVYTVTANRFLRGMVRGMVGTMLRVGTRKITMSQFDDIIKSRDCSLADFSVPAHGLFLTAVLYKDHFKK
ncbi:MAG: tRNA pseudouridine(38-40) synthase TruA [Ginsengibacter sp.]